MTQSWWFSIVRYKIQSSANKRVLDETDAGKSLMNTRKSNGPIFKIASAVLELYELKHKFHPLSNIQIKLQILDFPNPNNPVVILRSRWSLHYPAIVPIEGAVLFRSLQYFPRIPSIFSKISRGILLLLTITS